ncbi:hypothetical protein HOK51_01070 [Candidatus Woesearchaeota archaeon]|jgi:hypothetical protein|nr:hypothetical protein [Candidatus Woesearchaeota archaeon]MBT6518406.1 hypothetical protein [Candidatus Woesearchaeota archaeon]MBT7366588.1 hypothetical protein [Candidatus Woesearchaeota archaeon]
MTEKDDSTTKKNLTAAEQAGLRELMEDTPITPSTSKSRKKIHYTPNTKSDEETKVEPRVEKKIETKAPETKPKVNDATNDLETTVQTEQPKTITLTTTEYNQRIDSAYKKGKSHGKARSIFGFAGGMFTGAGIVGLSILALTGLPKDKPNYTKPQNTIHSIEIKGAGKARAVGQNIHAKCDSPNNQTRTQQDIKGYTVTLTGKSIVEIDKGALKLNCTESEQQEKPESKYVNKIKTLKEDVKDLYKLKTKTDTESSRIWNKCMRTKHRNVNCSNIPTHIESERKEDLIEDIIYNKEELIKSFKILKRNETKQDLSKTELEKIALDSAIFEAKSNMYSTVLMCTQAKQTTIATCKRQDWYKTAQTKLNILEAKQLEITKFELEVKKVEYKL